MTEKLKNHEEKKEKKVKKTKSKSDVSGQTAKEKKSAEKIEVLTKELENLNDKYLRIIAEFDNYKKRKEREFKTIIENANQQVFLELLPVIDDFERSLNSTGQKKNYTVLKDGIDLIYKKLIAVLEKQGLEPIAALEQPFNPEFHEALMQVEVKDKASNIVVEEALKGYKLRDKVIRHTKVMVNK